MSTHPQNRSNNVLPAEWPEEAAPREGPAQLATAPARPASPWPSSLESLAKQIADRIWALVTSRPEQAHLYTGYYIGVERAAINLLAERFRPGRMNLDGSDVMFWVDPQSADGFAGRMTEDVVEVLNIPLCRSHTLSLIAIEIPDAIQAVIDAHLRSGLD